ncbi:uncharacterized protein LOC122011508 [Zingiber officinale]|uniref:Uncharacterized protein n=1 Tax=Zingiber officinale TaxID=94328 RepID=A0A8J5I0L3_ZINOF|nr:uncharacterized protein LOC122011508 [Zingiber officinale]KAG6538092.1 hypothetical protein ZIOFF_003195 [Zingiber officinale]
MAFRRKQSAPRLRTFEGFRPFREQSSLLSASCDSSSASSSYVVASRDTADRQTHSQDSNSYYYTSMKNENEAKYGFWGVLTRQTKTMLEDDKTSQKHADRNHQLHSLNSRKNQLQSRWSSDSYHEKESPTSRNRSREFSVRDMGVPTQSTTESGWTIMGNKTAGMIQEASKLQIRGKSAISDAPDQSTKTNVTLSEADFEVQLKASRDIANKMAAKVKILLQELNTVKADLAFTNKRCTQLEEENKSLRENHRNGDYPADDDLVRLQMETLLAEKSRLANENTIYTRENMFLREIVEYHQLTTQDMVYLDENIEEDNSEAFSIDQFSTFPSPSHPIHEMLPTLAPRSPSPSASLHTVGEPGLVDTELSSSSAVEGI